MNDSPKIAIISPTQGSYGGIEITAIAQAEYIQQHFRTQLHFKLTKGYKVQDSLTDVLKQSGTHYRITERGIPALWKTIREADVIHAHNVSIDVVLCSIFLGKPLFFTIHNRYFKSNIRHFIAKFLQHLAVFRVYNSNFVAATWSSFKSPRAERFPSVSRFPNVNPLPPEERRGFFFIGRWIENKGIGTLIQAYQAANLDKTRHPLYLAGSGPLKQKLIDDQSLPEGVHYLGFLTDDEKYRYYCKVRWNVAPPNTFEDMGLTPIEARHCHTPSIITRDGGLPEAAGHAAIICEPASVHSLRIALESAAAIEDADYAQRSEQAFSTLKTYLKSYEFFISKYTDFQLLDPAI